MGAGYLATVSHDFKKASFIQMHLSFIHPLHFDVLSSAGEAALKLALQTTNLSQGKLLTIMILYKFGTFISHGLRDLIPVFFFFSPMWHKSDMTNEHVAEKKSQEFRYSQISVKPHSHVEINLI